MLQNNPLRLPPFNFGADPDRAVHFDADPGPDPDPAFHFDAVPVPASQNDADPCGSGSETLVIWTSNLPFLP